MLTCSPCSTDDIVTGLWQVSEQLHNLSVYVAVACGLVVFALFVLVILTFTGQR